MVLNTIEEFLKSFLEEIQKNKVHVISHFDTDGITSAAILSQTLKRLDISFSTKIIKQLYEKEILSFPEDKIIILLDLGSNSFDNLKKTNKRIFIIDHHQPSNDSLPENITIINPHLIPGAEDLCAAELTYLVSKRISEENKNLAHLAVLGMVGDTLDKNINKTRNQIIKDANVQIKKGLLIYPSTRPIDKALEYSSRPFIPGVTGDSKGTFELLKEAGIEKFDNRYKALIDLTETEMKNLATAVTLRLTLHEKTSEYFGNLFLLKFFNKIEDAREISAVINACSRMDQPETALLFCLGNPTARKQAERIHVKYRQHIISGLKYIEKHHKIQGREYVIINTKDKVKDTLIGTLASILSFSSMYKEGTIIIAMAYNEDKIKVSTRLVGRNSKTTRNLKELIESIAKTVGGESGGHQRAAGCLINKQDEEKFIELIKRKLEFEVVKV